MNGDINKREKEYHFSCLKKMAVKADTLIIVSPFVTDDISKLIENMNSIKKITSYTTLQKYDDTAQKVVALYKFCEYCKGKSIDLLIKIDDNLHPKIERGKIIEPNKLSFEQLKEFSVGILWKDKSDSMYKWVDKIQHYRNAIHAFNYRDIGTAIEFINDMDIFYDYVEMILKKIPSVEDYLEYYPISYDINPYYAD